MERVGYVNLDVLDEVCIVREMKALRKMGIKKILHSDNELNDLEENSELVVYDIKSLGKSVLQLEHFLSNLIEKNIQFTVANKHSKLSEISGSSLIGILKELAETEHYIIRERTVRGLNEAKRKGRIGGRPTVSEETIDRIRFLYHNQNYTLRDIAAECGVSLGTAYKYVQD